MKRQAGLVFVRARNPVVKVLLIIAVSAIMPFSASALTPLKSPQQLAQDEILFEQASRSIGQAAMRCFAAPSEAQRSPVTIRFFVADAGKKVSQLTIIQSQPRLTAMQRAAFRAIKRCAPYVVPDELRSWGGFWAKITFR